MKTSLIQQLRLLLVLVALLSYGSQSFAMLSGMLAHSQTKVIVDQVMPHCHADEAHPNPSDMNRGLKHGSDCCDGGCSMLGCHATSAMVSSVVPLQFDTQNLPLSGFQFLTLCNPPSVIFHPPILS